MAMGGMIVLRWVQRRAQHGRALVQGRRRLQLRDGRRVEADGGQVDGSGLGVRRAAAGRRGLLLLLLRWELVGGHGRRRVRSGRGVGCGRGPHRRSVLRHLRQGRILVGRRRRGAGRWVVEMLQVRRVGVGVDVRMGMGVGVVASGPVGSVLRTIEFHHDHREADRRGRISGVDTQTSVETAVGGGGGQKAKRKATTMGRLARL